MGPVEAARVLGLEPGATVAEIEAAYRRVARLTHPDSSDAKDATAFVRAGLARDVLLRAAGVVIVERPGYRPPPRWLIAAWIVVVLVAIFIATFRNDWPLTWVEEAVRFTVVLGSLVGFALTGRRWLLVVAVVSVCLTAALTVAFTTFGGLVGMLVLIAPTFGLLLLGVERAKANARFAR